MTFHVTKRDGSLQDLNTQNIMKRVKNVSKRFNINVPLTDCVMKVVDQLYDKINASEIDELLADIELKARPTKEFVDLAVQSIAPNLKKYF